MIIKLIFLILLLVASPSWAGIVWQEDFDAFTSGWTPSQGGNAAYLFPWQSTPTGYPPGASGYGISNYEPSTIAAGSRTNDNSWNGWLKAAGGHLSIETTGGRNNTPVLRIQFDKATDWIEDTGLLKWLGPTQYQELYIRYYFKYGNAQDWRWGGSNNPRPTTGILWKQFRAWTGFNPVDYSKSGGQTLPAENTTPTDESNWRYGIWVHDLIMPGQNDPWGVAGKPFFMLGNFYWPLSCSSPCDSQNLPRGGNANINYLDWEDSSPGWMTTYVNSGNAVDTDGSFTEDQTWHWIEWHIKNNTSPGAGDGLLEIWIDEIQVTNPSIDNGVKASMSTNANDYGLNLIFFNANNAYLTKDIAVSPGYQYYYIDDIVISTTGPIGAVGGGPPSKGIITLTPGKGTGALAPGKGIGTISPYYDDILFILYEESNYLDLLFSPIYGIMNMTNTRMR